MEAKIPLAKIYEHDLGIPDSHILGSKNIPFHVLLWRNQRVYYFTFSKPTENSAQRIKDLIARFRTRELRSAERTGHLLPLRLYRRRRQDRLRTEEQPAFHPHAQRDLQPAHRLGQRSLADPSHQRPLRQRLPSRLRPAEMEKSALLDSLHIGKRLAAFEGWRLDPRPDSGERERAWFGLAHTGGTLDPLVAIQVQTFQKGTDDLTDYTPPPKKYCPA